VVDKNLIFRIAVIFILLNLSAEIRAQEDRDFLLRLEGLWKFSIGDSSKWSNPDFDDSNWESIKVPSPWEDQGFYGHDGYAWYRTSFVISKDMKNKELYLSLGYINDVDQVYVNGRLIGFSGTFPPEFSTCIEARRKYPLPVEYLNLQSKNVIAVRVYNHQMIGGIISGDIGIFSYYEIKPDISLLGLWSFKTGDNKACKALEYKDKQWKKIIVPGSWKNQGYKDYDGIVWYRRHFAVSDELASQKLILIIGKIENFDEVYINGVLIGSSGKIPIGNESDQIPEEPQKKIRAYRIPEKLLRLNKDNAIAVRVYGTQQRGGVIEGPVGIVKLSNFTHYYNNSDQNVEN
jgi:hypothetical protein